MEEMAINGNRSLSLRDLKEQVKREVKEELQKEYNKKLQAVEDLKDEQAMATDETDEYMVGLYNGLELACACIAGRDPEFKDIKTSYTAEEVGKAFEEAMSKIRENTLDSVSSAKELEKATAEYIKQMQNREIEITTPKISEEEMVKLEAFKGLADTSESDRFDVAR